MANFNGVPEIETPEFMMSKLEEFGGEGSYGHYAVGWAWAMNSLPVDQASRLTLGRHAQRHGRALAQGIKEKGGIRNQFSHVIDIAPTVFEATCARASASTFIAAACSATLGCGLSSAFPFAAGCRLRRRAPFKSEVWELRRPRLSKISVGTKSTAGRVDGVASLTGCVDHVRGGLIKTVPIPRKFLRPRCSQWQLTASAAHSAAFRSQNG